VPRQWSWQKYRRLEPETLHIASAARGRTDPPDFVCESTADHAEIGVELTQLTFEERIGEQARFDQIKRDVLTKGRGQLAHLRGFAVVHILWG
jgi:hypothetical protein